MSLSFSAEEKGKEKGKEQQKKRHFYGEMVGGLVADSSFSDHCIVMVRVPFCSFCHSLDHLLAECGALYCTFCKKHGHTPQACSIRCSGCQKAGHFRQECLKCPCTHCGGAHAFRKSKVSDLPLCPIIKLAREGTQKDGTFSKEALKKIVSVIEKEYSETSPDAFFVFSQELIRVHHEYESQPVKRLGPAKHALYQAQTAAIRKFIEQAFSATPEHILECFVKRVQPLLVFTEDYHLYPESHQFSSTIPSFSDLHKGQEGKCKEGKWTIKARQAYRSQPSKAEALAIAFLGYTFSVETQLTRGGGWPLGS